MWPQIATAVLRRPSALIEIESTRDRIDAIGTICRMLPRAKILVPVLRRAEMKQVKVDLQEYVAGNIAAVSGGNWQSECRVVCCTFRAWETSNSADWDLVLVYDAIECLVKTAQQCLLDYIEKGRFGLVRDFDALDLRSKLTLETGFGSLVRPSGSSFRQAQVAFASPPLLQIRSRSSLERKRQIWTDQRRNDFIAAIANSFARRLNGPLWDSGLFLDMDEPCSRWQTPPNVVLVVENEHHAVLLANLLPNWRLEGRTPDVGRRQPAESGWRECVILTASAVRQRGPLHHEIVINAVGGDRPCFQLQQRPAGRIESAGTLVVDFADDGDAIACRQTQARLNQYCQLGWLAIEQPEWLREPSDEPDIDHPNDHLSRVHQRRRRTPRAGAIPAD